MDITHRATVTAGIDRVWAFVSDLPAVIQCVPGALLRDQLGDGRYQARIGVAAGDFSVSLGGIIGMEAKGDNTAIVRASGGDRMKTITCEAQATITLEPLDNDNTVIAVAASFEFSGYLAPAARVGAPPVARALLDEFASCVARQFSSRAPATR